MTLRSAFLAVLLVGCKGEEPEDTDQAPLPTPSPASTGDTATLSLEPAAFAVAVAEFAVNANGQAVGFQGFDQAGNPVQAQVSLTILLLDQRAANTGTIGEDDSCQITIAAPGPIDPWPSPPGTAWWGFTLPAGTPVVAETCSEFEFPAEWGDITSKITQHDWGFGVAPMVPQIQTALQQQLGANWSVIEDSVVGAGWYNPLLASNAQTPGGFADGGYALGSQVDANLVMQVDGTGQPILLDASAVWDASAGAMGVGAYTAQGLSFLQPASLLVNPPSL